MAKDIKFNVEARDALKKFISNKKLQIEFLGPDKYSFRVIGILYIVNNKINNKV